MAAPFQLLALLAGVAASPLSPVETLHTPDAIAPAVLPYLACLYAERGLPLLRAADGRQVTYDKSTSDCSAARARAKADAATLLHGAPVPDGLSEGAYIERTLADMDAYVASLPMTKSSDRPAPSVVVGIPVTIEDALWTMYSRYDECLKTQVSHSLVSADTIVAKFREAMTACSSVRAYAVSEAAKALTSKGWDEETRQKAAESTFDKVDQSWLAMGGQYRQVLLKRIEDSNKAPARKPH